MPLLDNADVRALVPQEDLSDEQLAVTMRLVAGWLREPSGRTDLVSGENTDPLADTDPLWAPALELVALVAENPTSLASLTSGPTSRTWPQARRREAILDEVRRTASRAAAAPFGSFPAAPVWPDPAGPWWAARSS